jgi:hypothetical protein
MEKIYNKKTKLNGIDGYLGSFYIENSARKNYLISCQDYWSRKTSRDWYHRKTGEN